MQTYARAVLLDLIGPMMALAAAVPAHAAPRAAKLIAVRVECICNDAAGKAYLAAFKDALSKDGRYVLKTASEGENLLMVRIVSRPITTAEGQPGNALSITCTHNRATMRQDVTTCVHISTDDCARSLVAGLGDLEG